MTNQLFRTEDGQQPKIGPSITANNPIIEPSFISGSTFSAAPNQNATSYSLPSYSQQSGYGQPTGQNTSDYPNQPGLPTPMPGLPARPAVQGIGEDYKVVEQQQQGRQMDDGPDGEPGAKKVKITSKKTDGGYYPEEDWIASHPVSSSFL